MIRSKLELISTLAQRFSSVRLREAGGDLWRSGDNAGMGKNESSDDRLGLGDSATCSRLFFPSLVGRLMLEIEGKVGSTAGRLPPTRSFLLVVVRREWE